MTPNQYTPEEPISSIATALAPAALGIVRVSGKGIAGGPGEHPGLRVDS